MTMSLVSSRTTDVCVGDVLIREKLFFLAQALLLPSVLCSLALALVIARISRMSILNATRMSAVIRSHAATLQL